jgi:hypothetical protein
MTKKMTKKAGKSTIPDYAFWAAMPAWTREEAIALLSGQDPDSSSGDIAPNDERTKVARLLGRAFESGAFPNADRIAPKDCLSAMESFGLCAPKALTSAAKDKKVSIKNWRRECETKDAEIVRLRQDIERTSIAKKRMSTENDITALKRKITTLQKVFLGISIDKFNLKREWKNSSAAKNIASSIDRSGLKLDEDTVRKHLTDAHKAVGRKAKFHGES